MTVPPAVDPLTYPYKTFIDVPVRWGDLDPLGHVNNCRMFQFLEEGRVHYFRVLGSGFRHDQMLHEFPFVLAHAELDFRQPLLLGDVCRVHLAVRLLSEKTVRHIYRLESVKTGQVIGTGETVLVSYDQQAKRSRPLPAPIREAITKFEGWT